MKNQSEIHYIVLVFEETATLNNGNEIKLSWCEGQIGAIPVFGTLEAAEAYCGNRTDLKIVGVKFGG